MTKYKSSIPPHIKRILRDLAKASIQDDIPKADFWRLVLEHHEDLFDIALKFRPTDPEKAHDLLLDAILRGHYYFESFRPNSNFKAWMGRIIFTIFVNETKKEKREAFSSDINIDQMDMHRHISPTDHHREIPPFEVWKSKEYIITVYTDCVAQALQKLNDLEKLYLYAVVCLDLKYVDAVDYLNNYCKDIIENHNKNNREKQNNRKKHSNKQSVQSTISLSAFKSKYFRTRHKLKEMLEKSANTDSSP